MRYQALPASSMFIDSCADVAATFLALGKPDAGVGGATHSRHVYGDSFDIRSSAASLDALADHCQTLGAGYIGWYESHIHCDWRDDPMSEAFFGPPGPPPQERSGCTDEDGPPLKEWFRG